MLTTTAASVSPAYVHYDKMVEPGEPLRLAGTTLKWHNLARESDPVPAEIYSRARAFLTRTEPAGLGEMGFVILHRCGADFYFLIVSSWRNENELWETVYARNGEAGDDFAQFPFPGDHRGTYCVWELAAVWHEQQAWKQFLLSPRDDRAKAAYLADAYRGPARTVVLDRRRAIMRGVNRNAVDARIKEKK